MPPDRHLPRDAFDTNLLDSQVLETPGGLAAALRAIEKVCYRGDHEIAEMIVTLDDHPYLLEYIISGTLQVLIVPYASSALTILHSSAGRWGIPEAPEVDTYRVSHIHDAEYDEHSEYAAPREVLIFVAFRGVFICCRCAPEPSYISKKGGNFFQRSQNSSGER